MLVQRFALWASSAAVDDRVDAVCRMVEAWRFAAVPEDRKSATSAMMTLALDDPSPRVRAALAEGLAPIPDAPWHVVRALLRDIPSVAEIVLRLATHLPQDEVSALIRGGAGHVAAAAAARPDVSAECAEAIVQSGDEAATAALLNNEAVAPGGELLERIAERHAHSPVVREALGRHFLSPATTRRLACAMADDLSALVADRGWMAPAAIRRLNTATGDAATLDAMERADIGERVEMANAMIDEGRLTSAFLVDAAVRGASDALAVSVSALSRLPLTRVSHGLTTQRSAGQWRIACGRAGLDEQLGDALRAATAVWKRFETSLPRRCATTGDAYERASRMVRREAVRAAIACLDVHRHPALLRGLLDAELELERDLARDHAETPLLAAA